MHYKFGRVIKPAVLMMLVLSVVFTGCKDKEDIGATNPEEYIAQTVAVENEAVDTEHVEDETEKITAIQVQTKYLSLLYPDTYSEVMRHQEVVSENIAMEIFSMETNASIIELFRIYFGDEDTGILSGYLTVEDVEIPVTYTICQYNNDDFSDEDTRILYLETMNCFNDIMNSLQADPRFSTEKTTAPVETKAVDLTFWSFSLPETMEYEETNVNAGYEIRFYGNVAGERIALYTIMLTDTENDTVLGTYDLNGSKKYLSVESYPIEPSEGWSDEDHISAYAMMGTINDVLQIIMSSENYSEYRPE